MSKPYQISTKGALQRFHKLSKESTAAIQLALPIQEVVALVQEGLMHVALAAFTQVAERLMQWEVTAIAGERHHPKPGSESRRHGQQAGYCVIAGQKVPLQRPRVRDVRQKEVPLGSYQMLQGASLMEDSVWNRIMHGLTTRGYSEVMRELEQAYGIEKSTVSQHFIAASRRRLDQLMSRPLGGYCLCAVVLDGTFYAGQELVVALGITLQGHKIVLGVRQGATENTIVVKQLLEDLRDRGVDFEVPRLYLLDGSKALQAAVRKLAGKAGLIQRCQFHKISNVVAHLPQEHQANIKVRLSSAYSMREHRDAQRALQRVLRELMDLNPSAARSLEEGMEETLTLHRLRAPSKLRNSLRTTNLIESAFATVEVICRRVKHWQNGDHRLRWVASALFWAESRWNRLHGYREMPILVKELELAVVRNTPVRHASVA